MKKTEIEQLDKLINSLKRAKSYMIDYGKKLERSSNAGIDTHTQKTLQKISADVSWAAMESDKALTDFARMFKGSVADVSTETKTYRPSAFHKYEH